MTWGSHRDEDFGMQCLGGPVGSLAFAAKYVSKEVKKHKQRLTQLVSLGETYPQEAPLALRYCCNTRLNYPLQLVPYEAAPEAYESAERDLCEAWKTIFKVQNIVGMLHTLGDEAHGAALLTEERIRLPLRHGGMGVPSIKALGDSALVASWAEIAARTSRRYPLGPRIAPKTPRVDPGLSKGYGRIILEANGGEGGCTISPQYVCTTCPDGFGCLGMQEVCLRGYVLDASSVFHSFWKNNVS